MLADRYVVAERERGVFGERRRRGHDGRAAGAVHQPGVERARRAADGRRGPPARAARARLPTSQLHAHETRAQSLASSAKQSSFCSKYYDLMDGKQKLLLIVIFKRCELDEDIN